MTTRSPGARRNEILDAVLPVVGHFGLKKSSMNELARAAGLSKQGLYLHFESKDALLAAAMERYFDTGLRLLDAALQQPGQSLRQRLVSALDAWFGRHYEHFNPASLEVIEPGREGNPYIEDVKRAVHARLAAAIASNQQAHPSCTPAELASVLFQFGLTWKEGHSSRAALRETFDLCVRACVPAVAR